MEDKFLTYKEAAEYLRMPLSSFYAVARHKLPVVRFGVRRVRFRQVDLDAYKASCVEGPKNAA